VTAPASCARLVAADAALVVIGLELPRALLWVDALAAFGACLVLAWARAGIGELALV